MQKNMKQLGLLLIGLWITTPMGAIGDKVTQDISLLPEECRTFIGTYYQDTPIAHIEIEKILCWDLGYEVILTDGTNIEFTSSGDWKDIEGKRAVPAALIPVFIREYVLEYYPAEIVRSIEKERREYSIELSNGIELTFNHKGKLIEVD